jgi:hypothetical protein
VSHALTHKVKTALLAQEWVVEYGKAKAKTFSLIEPRKLLKAWTNAYQPSGQRTLWYTMLSRSEIEQTIQTLTNTQLTFASYSAARLLAPYARHPSEFFYASRQALELLQARLELKSVDRGENIVIYLEPNEDIFRGIVPKNSLPCTSPIQTYLDLSLAGNRGQEAAEYLLVQQLRRWEQL